MVNLSFRSLIRLRRPGFARDTKSNSSVATTATPHESGHVPRIVTGMQPTGQFHIGNYLGTLKQWKSFQDSRPPQTCYFFLADLHALSDVFAPRPESQIDPNIRENTLRNFATVLACGVDPARSHFYIQSQVPMISELFWVLSAVVPLHWLNRMTQFKSKKFDMTMAALYTYPILMAADILMFKGELVPVGEDQIQHIEFARECAERVNRICSQSLFPKPRALLGAAPRIMSLHDAQSKMSKSDPLEKNKINLLDRKEVVRAKVMRAKTDSLFTVNDDPQRRELVNLVSIFAGFQECDPEEIYRQYEGRTLPEFKEDLVEVINNELEPLQARFDQLMKDRAYLSQAIEQGKLSVLEEAYKNLTAVKSAFNLITN